VAIEGRKRPVIDAAELPGALRIIALDLTNTLIDPTDLRRMTGLTSLRETLSSRSELESRLRKPAGRKRRLRVLRNSRRSSGFTSVSTFCPTSTCGTTDWHTCRSEWIRKLGGKADTGRRQAGRDPSSIGRRGERRLRSAPLSFACARPFGHENRDLGLESRDGFRHLTGLSAWLLWK
jgi:hypothetical protein